MKIVTRLLSFAVVAAVMSLASSASAQDFFYNQYGMAYGGPVTSQAFVSPAPMAVSPWVGHTYISYPPLTPYHMLGRHTDRYHQYYDNGRGYSSTRIHYSTAPVRSSVGGIFRSISLPRP